MLFLRLMVLAFLQFQLRDVTEGTGSCRTNSHIKINQVISNGRHNADGVDEMKYIGLTVDRNSGKLKAESGQQNGIQGEYIWNR